MEFEKIYSEIFNDKNYNHHLNDEPRFKYVYDFVIKNKINHIGDFGSGRGNLIDVLKKYDNNIIIDSYDLKKFHDLDVPFYEINLCNENELNKNYEFITCLDVMEHLEKQCVDNVLKLFSDNSKYSILTIANHSDVQNGVELHLIQENQTYWSPKIEQYFNILDFNVEYGGRLYLYTLESKKNIL